MPLAEFAKPDCLVVSEECNRTLNGTIAVIPISLDLARQIIPSKYRILEHAYQALLPSFPQNMYPAFIQVVQDHDIRAFGLSIPDFSRAGIEFPFLDLLQDNSTSFKWVPSLLITATNLIALQGARDYGTNVYAAEFNPVCDAYSATATPGTTELTSKSIEPNAAFVSTKFSTCTRGTYPWDFYKNVTNQPIFVDGKTCDNMIRLFNTSVTMAPNRIDFVTGEVKAKIPPFKGEVSWQHVHGLRLDTSFIENNHVPCENLRGYGTG